MMRRSAVLLFLVLSSCGYTVDEVQTSPPRFTMTVPAAWDRVGNCLAKYFSEDYEALYLPVTSERRADLIVKFTGPGIVQYKTAMYALEIRGGDQTTVAFRRRDMASGIDDKVRAEITRCGAA